MLAPSHHRLGVFSVSPGVTSPRRFPCPILCCPGTDLTVLMGFASSVTWGTSSLLAVYSVFQVIDGELYVVFSTFSGLQSAE